jgi:hypothetical protein
MIDTGLFTDIPEGKIHVLRLALQIIVVEVSSVIIIGVTFLHGH